MGTRSAIGGRNVLTIVAETGSRPVSTGTTTPRVRPRRSRAATAGARRSRPRSSSRVASGASCSSPRSGRSRFPPAPRSGWPRSPTWSRRRSRTRRRTTRLRRFGDEQAALGRVATLVAAGAAPEQVFTAVVEEVSSLLGLERIELVPLRRRRTRDRDRRVGRAPVPRREHVVARRPERDGDGRPDEARGAHRRLQRAWRARSPASHGAQAFNRRSAHR